MASRSARAFSPAWVIASYFMETGGVALAIIAYGLWHGRAGVALRPEVLFAVGAAVGGLLAGRASPHRSFLEPAVAGALVVASVAGFLYATPLGRLVITAHRDLLLHAAIEFGGWGAGGGLVGAIVGELTTPSGDPPDGMVEWLCGSVVITAGALFCAATAAAIVLVDHAAARAASQYFAGDFGRHPLVNGQRIALAIAATGAAASFVGGLVTQMAAPRQMLLCASAGAFVLIGATVLWAAHLAGHRIDVHTLWRPVLVAGGAAAAVAFFGAGLGLLLGPVKRVAPNEAY